MLLRYFFLSLSWWAEENLSKADILGGIWKGIAV